MHVLDNDVGIHSVGADERDETGRLRSVPIMRGSFGEMKNTSGMMPIVGFLNGQSAHTWGPMVAVANFAGEPEGGYEVRFGSKAPHRRCPLNVRFGALRGPNSIRVRCLTSATSGLMHYSKRHPYSITSSASDRRLSEILTPSPFAVLRLITSSNLVGCTTGRSAGLSPLRMRPT
jgi:hypothetical protein